MHIFITIFALTWTKGFIFFHYGCYYHGGLLPHLFCMTCSKLVCPFLLTPKLVLRSQHCTFVILTSQLWNKQERLQVLAVMASRVVPFFPATDIQELLAQPEQVSTWFTDQKMKRFPGRESTDDHMCLLKMTFVWTEEQRVAYGSAIWWICDHTSGCKRISISKTSTVMPTQCFIAPRLDVINLPGSCYHNCFFKKNTTCSASITHKGIKWEDCWK